MSKKTAVMKGDGIGPEVVDSMLRVLKECNFQSEIILCEVGSEQWEKNGRKDASYIPESTMKYIRRIQIAVLKDQPLQFQFRELLEVLLLH